MKARHVGSGDLQIKGESYMFTYSAVISMVSIRIIVIFSIIWRVQQDMATFPVLMSRHHSKKTIRFCFGFHPACSFPTQHLRNLVLKASRILRWTWNAGFMD